MNGKRTVDSGRKDRGEAGDRRRQVRCSLIRSPIFLFPHRVGISLLEVVAVVTVLGIICWIMVPRLAGNSLETKRNACYTSKGQIEVQIELWYRNKAAWPAANLSDIATDAAYFPEGLPICPVDGTQYTMDETTHRVVGHVHPIP